MIYKQARQCKGSAGCFSEQQRLVCPSQVCAEGAGYAHALWLEVEREGKTQGYKEVCEIGHTCDAGLGCCGGSYQELTREVDRHGGGGGGIGAVGKEGSLTNPRVFSPFSGVLGFFLMLSTVKLRSILAPGQCAAWIFFAKVRERGRESLPQKPGDKPW